MHCRNIVALLLFAAFVDFTSSLDAIVAGRLPSGTVGSVAVFDKSNVATILGGANAGVELNQVLRFNVSSGEVSLFTTFPFGVGFGSAEIDSSGNIFYFGGFSNQEFLSSIFMLAVGSSDIVQVATLPYPIAQHSSTYDLGEYVYIFGGQAYGIPVPMITRFSVVTYESDIVAMLPSNLYGASATWNVGAVYLFGGVSNSYATNQIWKYTPSTNETEVLPGTMGYEVITTTAVAHETDSYIIGGYPAFGTIHHVTKFDSLTGVATRFNVTNFPDVLDTTAAIFDANTNSIYTFGGSDMVASRDDIFDIVVD